MEGILGDNPQTPTREAEPLWTLPCLKWWIPQGAKPLWRGHGGVPRASGTLAPTISPRRGAGYILPGAWGCPPISIPIPPMNGGPGGLKKLFL